MKHVVRSDSGPASAAFLAVILVLASGCSTIPVSRSAPKTSNAQSATVPTPGSSASSAYQRLVGSDWNLISSAYGSSDCRQPALTGTTQSNEVALPVDIPACRGQLSSVDQAAVQMLGDLERASVPAPLSSANDALKASLGDLQAASLAEMRDVDNHDAAAFTADGTPLLLAFNQVKFAAVKVLQG